MRGLNHIAAKRIKAVSGPKQWAERTVAITWVMFWLLVPVVGASEDSSESNLDSFKPAQLKERLQRIDEELGQLANPTPRMGVGNLGWTSRLHDSPENKEWIEIKFKEEVEIDLLVLVPVIWRDTSTELVSDGFPSELRIVVGKKGEREGREVASFGPEDNLLPRVAPLAVPIEPVVATWVRVEATRLTPRALDGRYQFQLSELLVFSGVENVALHQRATVSSAVRSRETRTKPPDNLVDGFVPYVIDAAQGDQGPSFVTFYYREDQSRFLIDLESTREIDRIHLHATDISENVPQVQHSDYAIPKHLLIEGANLPDFSDAVTLVDYHRETVYSSGPVIMFRFPATSARYVRLTAIDGYKAPEAGENWRCMGFTEIELFQNGRNLAMGKKVEILMGEESHVGLPLAMTDGLNHFGKILDVRDWMVQLARRHDLEVERPKVVRELGVRYERRSNALNYMQWIVVLLAVGLIVTFLVDRIYRMRQVSRIKRRFAADLHDEVGANLHAIALLSDTARAKLPPDDGLVEVFDELREISLETTTATQNCTSMLEAKGICENLAEEIRRTAKRLMFDVEHDIQIDGAENLQRLSARRRIDLLLFYKECLVNVIRHSHATEVKTLIRADNDHVTLVVEDNGSGPSISLPPSLSRRARLLSARVKVESPETGGTSVVLRLKTRRLLGLI